MSHLVEHMAQLAGQRDPAALDSCFVDLFAELLAPLRLRVLRSHAAEQRKWYVTRHHGQFDQLAPDEPLAAEEEPLLLHCITLSEPVLLPVCAQQGSIRTLVPLTGDSDEIDWVLRRLKANYPDRPLYAVGVSLGGNALLKWLGEREAAACEVLQAAAAVSCPFDMSACGHHLASGFNRLYTQYFLRSLKDLAGKKLQAHPGLFNEREMRSARTLFEFDDIVTAPLHGFAGAADYWCRTFSKPSLGGIRVPTLLINARNDPFMPTGVLPEHEQL